MKNRSVIIIAMLGIGFIFSLMSCKKQLDEVIPQTQISNTLALTDANATQALYVGVYAYMRSYNGFLFNMGEMRSEIWYNGNFTESADALSVQLYEHNIRSTSVPYAQWAGLYNLLFQVNNAIKIIPQSPVTEPNKSKWLAEMYGLRAYIYYTMLKTWGKVPITTEPIAAAPANAALTYKARSSRDSVMLQIKADIDQSLTLFGNSNVVPAGKRVFWNRIATLTLKGDVFIWSGTHLGGGNADFTVAKTALQEIKALEGATLDLNTSYATTFNPGQETNNKEIIFALNYEQQQANLTPFLNFLFNTLQGTTLTPYQRAPLSASEVYTMTQNYPNITTGTANRVGMSPAMITRLTSGPADQRITSTFRQMYSTTPPYTYRGVFLSKWTGSSVGATQFYDNDFPISRYADVLLLLAEAKTKLGEDPSAEINKIRQRAYGAAAPVFVSGSITANMNAILDEYLREFIGEGRRWWALRRAGDSYVYANIDPTRLSPTSLAKLELPITQAMISNDPLLKQTEGYTP